MSFRVWVNPLDRGKLGPRTKQRVPWHVWQRRFTPGFQLRRWDDHQNNTQEKDHGPIR